MKAFDIITVSGNLDKIAHKLSNELIKYGAKRIVDFRRETIKKYGIKNNIELEKLFFDIEKITKGDCYECWLESKQIGEKLGVLTGEIIAYSGFSDFIDLLNIESAEDECTAFVWCKNSSSLDWIACGQTWDFKKFYENQSIFIKRCPTNGYKTLVLTTLLGHAYFGINENGVSIMIQNLKSKEVAVGLPFSLIVYKVLIKSSSAREARDIIKNSPRMSGHNYIVVDSSGVCFSLEATANHVSVVEIPKESFLVHTNHSISSELSDSVVYYSKTSLQRRGFLYEKLKSVNKILKDEEVKLLFSDHSVPICRHEFSEYDTATIGSLWIKPKKKSIVAIKGYPCSNTYREYKLEVVK